MSKLIFALLFLLAGFHLGEAAQCDPGKEHYCPDSPYYMAGKSHYLIKPEAKSPAPKGASAPPVAAIPKQEITIELTVHETPDEEEIVPARERRLRSAGHTPPENRGAIDVTTGQFYAPAAGGVVDPRTGTFHQDVGAGYVDTTTGKFSPKIGPR